MEYLNRQTSVKFYSTCWFLQLFISSIIFGGVQMSFAEELILDEEPIVATGLNQQAKTLDLFSEDRPLGPNDSPILAKEGKITYQEWYIKYLSPSEETPLAWPIDADRKKWDLYFIRFPFTLNATPKNRYYKKVIFHISLNDKSATAFDLYPKDIKTKEEVEKAVGIAPEGKFKDIELKLGSYNTTVKFTRLRPEITAFGEGQHSFYWIYSGLENDGVSPGTKHALIILKVPHGKQQVGGEIYYEAVMFKEWLGEWRSTEANTARDPFVWKLRSGQ